MRVNLLQMSTITKHITINTSEVSDHFLFHTVCSWLNNDLDRAHSIGFPVIKWTELSHREMPCPSLVLVE